MLNDAQAHIRERVDPDTGEIQAIRPFAEWLLEHTEGELHAELSEALNVLVQQVNRTGRKGALLLTVHVLPAGDMVAVKAEVTNKLPKVDAPVKSYFVDEEGNLSRSNPQQLEIPNLRVAN